jgi:hypothetical protein
MASNVTFIKVHRTCICYDLSLTIRMIVVWFHSKQSFCENLRLSCHTESYCTVLFYYYSSVICFPLFCLKQVQPSISQTHKNNNVKIMLENKIIASENAFRIHRINSKPNGYERMFVALGAQIGFTTSNPLAWCHVELCCDYCVSFRFVSSPCLVLPCLVLSCLVLP